MLPRSVIKRGLYITSAPSAPPGWLARARETEARRVEAIEPDNAQFHEDRLKELAAERKALSDKMAALQARIAAIAGKSK